MSKKLARRLYNLSAKEDIAAQQSHTRIPQRLPDSVYTKSEFTGLIASEKSDRGPGKPYQVADAQTSQRMFSKVWTRTAEPLRSPLQREKGRGPQAPAGVQNFDPDRYR